jgi:FtsH-binding integral membrane protein
MSLETDLLKPKLVPPFAGSAFFAGATTGAVVLAVDETLVVSAAGTVLTVVVLGASVAVVAVADATGLAALLVVGVFEVSPY